ncbi:MAG: adenine phosphoribosyltransferase [Anaerolineaceae bacterium]
MDLKSLIRDVPDFPNPGILFRDVTPLLSDPVAFRYVINALAEMAGRTLPGAIVGIESRGFLFGSPVAVHLGLPFVPVRKPGKLPAARMSVEYSLEYGESQLDIHQDGFEPGTRAYVIDDLLATGGTARAAAKLVEMARGEVAGFGFVIELEALGGRRLLAGYQADALVKYRAGE